MNGYSRLSSRLMPRVVPSIRRLGIPISEGFDDPHELERWEPRLRLASKQMLVATPYVDLMPAAYRRQCRVMAALPFLHKYDSGVLRYTFGAA